MIFRVWALAHNTFREAGRQKVLYVLLFFTAVLILFSLFLGQLSLHADTKIIKDMGLACIMMLGALISISVGIGLVFKEIDRRTIYTILTKPVSRPEFVLGKFVGLALTVGVVVTAMTLLLFGVLSFYREPLDFGLLKAIGLIYMELCILIGVALLFSSYSSSLMSSLFCLSFLIVGHVTDDFARILIPKVSKMMSGGALDRFGAHVLSSLAAILDVFNLDHFVINAEVVHGVPISWDRMANAFLYAVCWLIMVLAGAIWLFRRKDLQ